MRALRNVKFLAAALLCVAMIGTAGFHFIEHWTWFDGFYMVLTTLTTIGYGETHPLSRAGRYFNVGIIFAGVGLVFIVITTAIVVRVLGLVVDGPAPESTRLFIPEGVMLVLAVSAIILEAHRRRTSQDVSSPRT